MSLQWHYSLFFVLVHDLRAFTSTDTNMPRGSQQKKMAHLEKKSQKEVIKKREHCPQTLSTNPYHFRPRSNKHSSSFFFSGTSFLSNSIEEIDRKVGFLSLFFYVEIVFSREKKRGRSGQVRSPYYSPTWTQVSS